MRQIIEEVQPEQAKTLFGPDFSASDAEDLQGKIKAPYVSVHTSSLGGRERLTIMVTVSWQPKDQWKQGILQNSNYAMFSFYQDGTVEQFQLSVYDERMMRIKASKWRKTKVKSMDDFVSKLNTYIEKVTKEIEHHG
jgi:hypothetical protein